LAKWMRDLQIYKLMRLSNLHWVTLNRFCLFWLGNIKTFKAFEACPITRTQNLYQSPTCRILLESPEYLLTNLVFWG
jgi:hypothetical protein